MSSDAFKRFAKLNPTERAMILEAFWAVATTQLVLKRVPFRWISARLQRSHGEPVALGSETSATARRIGWAVMAASKPVKAVCLGQAIAAQKMLNRRRIPSTLYLGVADDAGLIAHAWLSVGDQIITGAAGHEEFTIVQALSSFSGDRPAQARNTKKRER